MLQDVKEVENGTRRSRNSRRRKPATPSELLLDIRNRYPLFTEAELRGLFREEACEYQEFVEQFAEFWFSLHFRKLTQSRKRTKEESEAALNASAGRMRERVTRLVFLSLKMPDGREFRAYKKRDCMRAGGLFTKVGQSLKGRQRVGDVFTDKSLAKVWDQRSA